MTDSINHSKYEIWADVYFKEIDPYSLLIVNWKRVFSLVQEFN